MSKNKWTRLTAATGIVALVVMLVPGVGRDSTYASGNGDTAVTMWAVIFNNPENCVGGCGADDLSLEDVNGSVLFVAGGRVQSNGRTAFAGTITKDSPMGVLFGPGLADPAGAEIHVVVRSHGRVIPELLDAQVSSLNGGCPPNDCIDIVFAQHFPADADADGVSTALFHLFSDGSVVAAARSVLRRTANGAILAALTRL